MLKIGQLIFNKRADCLVNNGGSLRRHLVYLSKSSCLKHYLIKGITENKLTKKEISTEQELTVSKINRILEVEAAVETRIRRNVLLLIRH